MNTGYILLHPVLGIYLGEYMKYPIFSNDLEVPVIYAYAFRTFEKAEHYRNFFDDETAADISIEEIQSKSNYIDVKTLIQHGYGKHTEKMANYIPMSSTEIH